MAAEKAGSSVLVACTNRYPETVETIAITTDGKRKDVVMTMAPAKGRGLGVPRLAGGDELVVSGELQVTHDSTIPGAGDLVGVAYSYEPKLTARLLLSRSASAKKPEAGRAISIGKPRTLVCKVLQHHRRIVFAPTRVVIPKGGLPWDGPSHINLVLSAHHPAAKPGNVLLIGQNEPATPAEPAHAKGNQGRINAIRFRGKPRPKPKRLRTAKRQTMEVPLSKKARVVYSLPIRDLKKGEQLVVRARMPVYNAHTFQARVSTQVLLSNRPGGSTVHNPARSAITCRGQIAKGNGQNCLPKDDYTTNKYGVARVLKSRKGLSYVNLAVVSSNPVTMEPDPTKSIRVRPGGFLEVRRYAAEDAPG